MLLISVLSVLFLELISIQVSFASSKRGLAVGPGLYKCEDTNAFHNVAWWYNWHSDEVTHQKLHCKNKARGEYVPMFWGEKRMHNSTLPHDTHYVLGFNEPNVKSQANMTPQRAAALWPEVEKKAQGRKIISPAVAGCYNSGHCINWFTQFFAACPKCRVDALAVHSYGCDAQHLHRSLETVAKHFNKKLWLTEFACHTAKTQEQQLHFMQEILPLLEASAHVERYSWFQTRLHSNTTFINTSIDLLEKDISKLNKLGKFYDDYTYTKVVG